jgi:hypothetical protein
MSASLIGCDPENAKILDKFLDSDFDVRAIVLAEIETMGAKTHATPSDKLGAPNPAATRRDNSKTINAIASDAHADAAVTPLKTRSPLSTSLDLSSSLGPEVVIAKSAARYAHIARLSAAIAPVNSAFPPAFTTSNACAVAAKFKLPPM